MRKKRQQQIAFSEQYSGESQSDFHVSDLAGSDSIPTHDDRALLHPSTFRHTLLTRQDEQRLGWLKDHGGPEAKAARDQLATCNQRLVLTIALRYRGRGVPLWDLIQEGNLGLLRAVEKFDPDLGFRFSTIASWWIVQAIIKCIQMHVGVMHIPEHQQIACKTLSQVEQDLVQHLGRRPSRQELADALEMSIDALDALRTVHRYMLPTISLDVPLDDTDNDLELLDIYEDPGIPIEEIVEHRVITPQLRQALHQALDTVLTPREKCIVLWRSDGKNLEEVGKDLSEPISKERVRQIEAKALSKLRQATAIRGLRDEFLAS